MIPVAAWRLVIKLPLLEPAISSDRPMMTGREVKHDKERGGKFETCPAVNSGCDCRDYYFVTFTLSSNPTTPGPHFTRVRGNPQTQAAKGFRN